MRNKALLYTRSEGGRVQPMDFDLYEDELENYKHKVEKKEVFCVALGCKINSRVVKFGKKYIYAFFFEDGTVKHADIGGFKSRKGYNEKEWIHQQYKEKTNA